MEICAPGTSFFSFWCYQKSACYVKRQGTKYSPKTLLHIFIPTVGIHTLEQTACMGPSRITSCVWDIPKLLWAEASGWWRKLTLATAFWGGSCTVWLCFQVAIFVATTSSNSHSITIPYLERFGDSLSTWEVKKNEFLSTSYSRSCRKFSDDYFVSVSPLSFYVVDHSVQATTAISTGLLPNPKLPLLQSWSTKNLKKPSTSALSLKQNANPSLIICLVFILVLSFSHSSQVMFSSVFIAEVPLWTLANWPTFLKTQSSTETS